MHWILLLTAVLASAPLHADEFRAGESVRAVTGLREPSPEELNRLHQTPLRRIEPTEVGAQRRAVNRGLSIFDGQLFFSETVGVPSLPSRVDNSELPYFPIVRSQGEISSCATFTITYFQFTHNTGLARGWQNQNEDNHTKFSPKSVYTMLNGGMDVPTAFADIYEILEKHGALLWEDQPYDENLKEWDTHPEHWERALHYRSQPMEFIEQIDRDEGQSRVKALLNEGYLVVFGTYALSWQFDKIQAPGQEAGSKIITWMRGTQGSHGVTIVGYDDDIWVDINHDGEPQPGEKGAFKVVNSWGKNWGNQGFIWVAYDAFRSRSRAGAPWFSRVPIAMKNAAYHLPVRKEYTPKRVGRVELSHDRRNQIWINFSNAQGKTITPAILNGQGGAFPVSGGFAFDLTELEGGSGDTPIPVQLNLRNGSRRSPLQLKDWSVGPSPSEISAAQSFAPRDLSYGWTSVGSER